MKKFLTMLFAIALVMTVFPCTALAEESTELPPAWDGTVDTSWYTEAEEGTTTFIITNGAQLAGLAKLVNNGDGITPGQGVSFWGKTVKLGADINLGNRAWTAIGTGRDNYKNFQGEFDGQKHTIYNLGNGSGKGLFGYTGSGGGNKGRHGAYLHDFTIDGAKIGGAGVVTNNAYHDNVLENITVRNATINGSGSAIAGGAQTSQFKNILAENITIIASNVGQLGGLFGNLQGQMNGSQIVSNYANSYCLDGTIISDADNSNLSDNKVIASYLENCVGKNINITINRLSGSLNYIGGFAAYTMDELANETVLFKNCGIDGLTITLNNCTSPMVGGFIGLRSGNSNYTGTALFKAEGTSYEEKSAAYGGFDGCYVINAQINASNNCSKGLYGGFVADSNVYKANSTTRSAVTYSNVTTDVDISAPSNAIGVGGFAGKVVAYNAYDATNKQPIPHTFSNCSILGTSTIGNTEKTNSGFIGTTKTVPSTSVNIEDCQIAGLQDLDKLWEQESGTTNPRPADWTSLKIKELLFGPGTDSNNSTLTFEQCTITFDATGGSAIASITQNYGEKVAKPQDPTKTGHTFIGWYTDKKLTSAYDFNSLVAGPLTLYAKWSINQYTIDFKDGNDIIYSITEDYNTVIVAPDDPTKTGYTFDGWNAEIPSAMPAEDMAISAQWTINQYTITFDTDGGTTIAPITQNYGTAVTAPNAPTKTGYTFDGWDTQIPETIPADNVTIKAQWTANQYTISFDTDGGTTIDPITKNYGTAVTAPVAPTKTGYTFDGWDAQIPSTIPAEDVTITALWTANSYSVVFDANGGSGSMNAQPFTYDAEQALSANGFSKTNMHFNGWNTATDGSGTAYAGGQRVSNLCSTANGEITLYAQWSSKPAQPITFDTSARTAVYGDGVLAERKAVADGVVTYTSSDETIAAVDENGTVTVLKAGTAIITAHAAETADYASGSASYTLTVSPKELTITISDLSVYVGSTLPDLATVDYTVEGLLDGDSVTITLSYTTEPNTATSGEYKITASGYNAEGNYSYTVNDGTLSVTYLVRVTYPPTIVSNKGDISLSDSRPSSNKKVTISPTPDEGYVLRSLTITSRSGANVDFTDNGDGTYTYRQPAGKVTIQAEFVLAFEDIEPEHQFYPSIEWAYQDKLMNGISATHFDRIGAVTRQQVWRVLARLINDEDPGSMAAAKEWAMAQGIADGTDPGAAATREEFVTMMWIAYGKPAADTAALAAYADADTISTDAIAAMAWAVSEGIVGGYEDGTLRPAATTSRGAFATVLYRYLAK